MFIFGHQIATSTTKQSLIIIGENFNKEIQNKIINNFLFINFFQLFKKIKIFCNKKKSC